MSFKTLRRTIARIEHWRADLARDGRLNPFVAAAAQADARRLTRHALEQLPLCEPAGTVIPCWSPVAPTKEDALSEPGSVAPEDTESDDAASVSSASTNGSSTSHAARVAGLNHSHTRALAALAHCLSLYLTPNGVETPDKPASQQYTTEVNAFDCLCGYVETSTSPTDECHRIATLVAEIVDRAARESCTPRVGRKWARLLRRLRDEELVDYTVECAHGSKVAGDVYFASQVARECAVRFEGLPVRGPGAMGAGAREFMRELSRIGFPIEADAML